MTEQLYKDQIVYLNEQIAKLSAGLKGIKDLNNHLHEVYEQAMRDESEEFKTFIRGTMSPLMAYVEQVDEIISEV